MLAFGPPRSLLLVSLLSHCLSAPTPAPPAPTPFTAEPRASLGSRRNRLQKARERPARSLCAPPAAPASPEARTPALPARLSRPFRCSSQDSGRRAAAAPLAPATPLPFARDRRRKRSGGHYTPACAPGWGDAAIPAEPRSPRAPKSRQLGAGGVGGRKEWQEAGPDSIQRIPRISQDFRGRTRPQSLGFGPAARDLEGPHPPPHALSRFPDRPPGRGSQLLLQAPRLEGTGRCSQESPAASGGGGESGGVGGGRLSSSPPRPLQRRPPHLRSRVRAATLTVGEQRRETEQGGAAARHPRGHGRGGSRSGQLVDDDLAPAGLRHIQLKVAVAPGCLCGCFGGGGLGVQLGDTLRGGGRPGRLWLHPPSWWGRSCGREELPPPWAGAPCRICVARGEPHARGSQARGASGHCLGAKMQRRLPWRKNAGSAPQPLGCSPNPNSPESADLPRRLRFLRFGQEPRT